MSEVMSGGQRPVRAGPVCSPQGLVAGLALAAVLLIIALLPPIRKGRDEIFVED
jgi:hypothetical protein